MKMVKAWPRGLPSERGKLPWESMDAAYVAMLDYLAPVSPEDEVSIDERRGAMKGAVAGSRAARRSFAIEIARQAASDGHEEAELRQAIALWQWAYRRAERNARAGCLDVRLDGGDGQRWSVTEPLSGIGAAFYPATDRHVDSSGGAKDSPTVLRGRVAGEFFGRAEHFIGVGIGRWVYLHGAKMVEPRVRWPIVAGLRGDSGSPHVRAWLHAQEPYWWEPVHDSAGNVSCSMCGRGAAADTRAVWETLTAHAKPREHPRCQLPRRQWSTPQVVDR